MRVGRYGKYKELTRPVQCKECKQCKIRLAYRTLCDPCAKSSQRCPACCEYKSEQAKCAPSRVLTAPRLPHFPPLSRCWRVGGKHRTEGAGGGRPREREPAAEPQSAAQGYLATASIDGGVGITQHRPLRPPRECDTAGTARLELTGSLLGVCPTGKPRSSSR